MTWVNTAGAQGINLPGNTLATSSFTSTPGNSIAVVVGVTYGLGDLDATTPVADNKGNLFVQKGTTGTSDPNNKAVVFVSTGIAGGAGHIITIKLASASGGYADVFVGESNNTGGVDTQSSNFDGAVSITAHPGPTFTAAANSDWFMGSVNNCGINPEIWTQGAGWTKGFQAADGFNGTAGGSQYKSGLAGGSTSAPYTTGDGNSGIEFAVGFKAAGGGGGAQILMGGICLSP